MRVSTNRLPVLGSLILLVAGCHTAPKTTGSVLPPGTGQTFSGRTESAARWRHWAASNVQSGDLVFVRGDSRILLGLVDFSRLCTDLTASRFSHVALASWEDGELFIYDIIRDGARRTPFAEFMGDPRVRTIGIRRLRPAFQQHIPGALAYCRQAHAAGVEFDQAFELNNDQLYCSELVEIAFRRAGLALSAPVPVEQLPGYGTLSPALRRAIRLTGHLTPGQTVLVPGNETLGLWASPSLELILDETNAMQPPGAAAGRP